MCSFIYFRFMKIKQIFIQIFVSISFTKQDQISVIVLKSQQSG